MLLIYQLLSFSLDVTVVSLEISKFIPVKTNGFTQSKTEVRFGVMFSKSSEVYSIVMAILQNLISDKYTNVSFKIFTTYFYRTDIYLSMGSQNIPSRSSV